VVGNGIGPPAPEPALRLDSLLCGGGGAPCPRLAISARAWTWLRLRDPDSERGRARRRPHRRRRSSAASRRQTRPARPLGRSASEGADGAAGDVVMESSRPRRAGVDDRRRCAPSGDPAREHLVVRTPDVRTTAFG